MPDIVITSPTGARRQVDPARFGAISYNIELYGGYADFSLPLSCLTSELTNIGRRDRVEVWENGSRLYRGYVSERARDASEPARLVLKGYGLMQDLSAIRCTAPLILATASDVVDLFTQIYTLWVEPRFSTSVLVTSTVTTGTLAHRFDATGKSVKQCFDELCDLTGGQAFWGVDVDAGTGKDRLYLRKVGGATKVISVPGVRVSSPSGKEIGADVVNRLPLQGGDMVAWRQNLLPNADFEKLVDGGDSDENAIAYGNLLVNPGFEIGSTHNGGTGTWNLLSGAVAKQNGGGDGGADGDPGDPDAYKGTWCIELSDTSETADQTVTGIVAGRTYGVRAFIRPADVYTTAAGRIEIQWLTAGNAPISSDFVSGGTLTATWEMMQGLFTAPATAAKAIIVLRSDSGLTLLYDCISFWDADSPAQESWQAVPIGTCAVSMDWAYTPAYHGIYAVKATVTGADTSGSNEVAFSPRAAIPVSAGGKYFFYVWLRTTSNPHAGRLKIAYVKADGTLTGSPYIYDFSGTGVGSFSPGFVWGTAPTDAVAAYVYLILRSNGDWFFDTFTFMEDRGLVELGAVMTNFPVVDFPGDGTTAYIPDGPLFATFDAADLVTALEDADVNSSATDWGIREPSSPEVVESIVSYPSALIFAKGYFLDRAKARREVSVTLAASETDPLPAIGDYLRLVGEDGAALSGGVDLPVARIQASTAEGFISGVVQAGKEARTIPMLLRQAARQEVSRRR